jgi:hypothetical protein
MIFPQKFNVNLDSTSMDALLYGKWPIFLKQKESVTAPWAHLEDHLVTLSLERIFYKQLVLFKKSIFKVGQSCELKLM